MNEIRAFLKNSLPPQYLKIINKLDDKQLKSMYETVDKEIK